MRRGVRRMLLNAQQPAPSGNTQASVRGQALPISVQCNHPTRPTANCHHDVKHGIGDRHAELALPSLCEWLQHIDGIEDI